MPKGRQVRVGDVARVEIGARGLRHRRPISNGKPTAVIILVLQEPGSNALAAAEAI